jgi:hypothetical protein
MSKLIITRAMIDTYLIELNRSDLHHTLASMLWLWYNLDHSSIKVTLEYILDQVVEWHKHLHYVDNDLVGIIPELDSV